MWSSSEWSECFLFIFFFGWLFREVVRKVVIVVVLAVETEFSALESYLVRIRDVKPIIAANTFLVKKCDAYARHPMRAAMWIPAGGARGLPALPTRTRFSAPKIRAS